MIVEYIRYQLPPDQVEGFVAAYSRVSAYLRSTPRVLAYEVATARDDSGQCIVRIEWDAISGHEEFSDGPLLRPFLEELGSHLSHIADMRHYTPRVVFRREP